VGGPFFLSQVSQGALKRGLNGSWRIDDFSNPAQNPARPHRASFPPSFRCPQEGARARDDMGSYLSAPETTKHTEEGERLLGGWVGDGDTDPWP
jgi:hypothetical protein